MITIFKNIKETSTPFYREIGFVFDRIKNERYGELVSMIRKESDKHNRNELKKDLPAICFSGEFTKRADDAITIHSGFICLDFDGYSTKREMLLAKEAMSSDPYVMAVFVSPSGNGLKVVVKIPPEVDNHKRYFDGLNNHFGSEYFDTTSKNISRVCYESSDRDIYINMDSKPWIKMADVEYLPMDRDTYDPTIAISNENKIVEILMKWWKNKYGLVQGERNHNIFILAAAFNEYGITKSLAEYIIGSMKSKDFPMSEIQATITSAYRNTSAHNTKYFEDTDTASRIRNSINKGELKSNIIKAYSDVEDIEDVVEKISADPSPKKFWTKSDKGHIDVVPHLFKQFLEYNGFYKFYPHNRTVYMFVRVTNNLIEKVSDETVKDFVLAYLSNLEDIGIYNWFAKNTKLFRKEFLSFIDTVNVHFIMDSLDYSYIYFKNCAVLVTRGSIEMVDYVDLEGYVWSDQVIDRDFEHCEVTDCDYRKFIHRISGDDPKRVRSVESTIGFLMSGYKDPGYCPAVILNDEVITENPEGGTGKGLFVQGVGKMKKVIDINGKIFDPKTQFAYQTVTTDTQVVSFDDVKKGFNFENLFSTITEGITIEKKNQDAIKIPFHSSPKIVITTNYAIRGKGNSFERRKWELELRQHYSMNHTPVDEFGKRFFDEWDDDEWCSYDNYMIGNLQYYIANGLVVSDFSNLAIRKLGSETCHEFIDWIGLVDGSKPTDVLEYNKKLFKDDLYNDFIQENPDFAPKAKMTISRALFYKWLSYFGAFKNGVDIVEGRDNMGRWIMFKDENYGKEEEGSNIALRF